MKELSKTFDSKGFHFEQIKRAENVALYKRSSIGTKHFHYEVIYVQSHNGYTINNVNYPPSEYYPRSEDWGCKGFTYNKLNDALKCFKKLLAYKELERSDLEEVGAD